LTEAERQLDELKEDCERLRHAVQASEKKYQVAVIPTTIRTVID